MTLRLADGLRARLIEQIARELTKATVLADFSVFSWSMRGIADIRSLPERGPLADALLRYIGEEPLSKFVTAEISRSFKGDLSDESTEKPLSQYEGYSDLTKVAEGVIQSFESLPWTYKVSVELPTFGTSTGEWLDVIELSPKHRIVLGARLRRELPLVEKKKGLSMMLMGTEPRPMWRDDSAYLQIDVEGYLEASNTEPFLAARDDVLTFFGLGTALGLYGESLGLMRRLAGTSHFYVHRRTETEWIENEAIEIDERYVASIRRLDVSGVARDKSDEIRKRVDRIGSIFRSAGGHSIRMAARWLFESHCGQDALLQYVQAAVAIEILLGDEEQDPNVGLSTLMANRCAFALGVTPKDRTELISQFREIYKVRSKIVHRGKNRLNARELELFGSLRALVRALIDHEQSMLRREEALQRAGITAPWR